MLYSPGVQSRQNPLPIQEAFSIAPSASVPGGQRLHSACSVLLTVPREQAWHSVCRAIDIWPAGQRSHAVRPALGCSPAAQCMQNSCSADGTLPDEHLWQAPFVCRLLTDAAGHRVHVTLAGGCGWLPGEHCSQPLCSGFGTAPWWQPMHACVPP